MNEPLSPVEVLKTSRNLIRKHDFSGACGVLQTLLSRYPENEEALELMGMARFYGGELPEAREAFEHLTRVNSGHVQGWVNLGAVLNRLGEHRKAVEVLRRALQKDRRCAEAYYNMGIAQRGLNLNTMAISAYKEALKLKPDLTEAHLNLGNIYVEMKNLGLAVQCFQTAVRNDPKSKKASYSLEKALQAQKDARKEESPFGRLVNLQELEKKSATTGIRRLSSSQRAAERSLVQDVTRNVRAAAKSFTALLEEPLHQQLHRLERIVLQNETRLSSAEHMEMMTQSIHELLKLRQEIRDGLNEIRRHLAGDRSQTSG